MAGPFPRALSVLDREILTPNLGRVRLGGEGLAGFPPDQATAHVKVLVPSAKRRIGRPTMRSYTVRDNDSQSLTIDYVRHGAGPASQLFEGLTPGDTVRIMGPGPTKRLPSGARRVLLAGDLTAVAAIAANLERLPADAVGAALIEIPELADQLSLAHPPGVEVSWIVGAGGQDSPLVAATRSALATLGTVDAWVAGEFSMVMTIRSDLREQSTRSCYVSSYWQQGASDEQHRVAKRKVD